MKILVTVKRVPNPDEPIRIRPDARAVDGAEMVHVLNPFDAIAVESALQIRDSTPGGSEVCTVSIGPAESENELRTAMAMGADRAIRIDYPDMLDSWNVARVLAAFVGRENPDLVMMGKQAVDDDANQAGQMLAAMLDWPQATFASRVRLCDSGRLDIDRETDHGIETILVRMPCVVTADLRLAQPRYASLPAMMKAKKRSIETIPHGELGVSIQSRIRIERLEHAVVERKCVRLHDAAELVNKLRFDAKVI